MASKNKMNKLKNSYIHWTLLKNKKLRLKKILFFTPSQRKQLKADLRKEL